MFARIAKLALFGVLAALVVTGCSSSSSTTEPQPQPTARIRVIQASPDFGIVDVYLGAETVPRVTNLDYLDASVYFSFNTPATIFLAFRRAGDPATAVPLFTSQDLDVASGSSISAVACGEFASANDDDKLRLLPLMDQWLAHESGESRVRVVNAGADADEITITIAGGAVLAGNLARFADSGLGGEPYPAGTTDDVNVFEGIGVTSFAAPTLDENADYYYVLTGLTSATGAGAFTLMAVGPGGAEELRTPAWIESETRVVHSSPDLATSDVYVVQGIGAGLTRTMVREDIAYGEASPWGALGGRAANIEIFAADTDPASASPIYRQSISLPVEITKVTVLALGLVITIDDAVGLRLLDMEDLAVSAPAGRFPVRYVHGTPDADTLLVDVGADGPEEATLVLFEVSEFLELPLNTNVAIDVREGAVSLGQFTTPSYSETGGHYLVFTGLKAGSPGFQMLSISPTAVLGFTDPDGS